MQIKKGLLLILMIIQSWGILLHCRNNDFMVWWLGTICLICPKEFRVMRWIYEKVKFHIWILLIFNLHQERQDIQKVWHYHIILLLTTVYKQDRECCLHQMTQFVFLCHSTIALDASWETKLLSVLVQQWFILQTVSIPNWLLMQFLKKNVLLYMEFQQCSLQC